MTPDFTPTQRRMLAVLRDGRDHTTAELAACLDDEQTGPRAVAVHLTHLRRKLRPDGMDVVYVVAGYRRSYRMVVDFAWFTASRPAAHGIPDPVQQSHPGASARRD